MKEETYCKQCSDIFNKMYAKQRFCSLPCANLYQTKLFPSKLRVCEKCRRKFQRKYKTQRYCSLRCYAKTNPRNQPHPVLFPSLRSKDFSELLGILAGDGCIGPYYITVSLNARADGEYPQYIQRLIEKLFRGVKATIHFQKRDNVNRVQASSVLITRFLKKIWPHKKHIPRHVLLNKNLHLYFVRGLFDTEGSMSRKIYKSRIGYRLYRQLTFTNCNAVYCKFVFRTLKAHGFRPTKPARNIYISNKKDIDRYFRLIGSRNPKLIRAWKMISPEKILRLWRKK